MRIGLIADIHGNLFALETVLAELAGDALDELICLGDVAALGPQPSAVLARLRALGCPVVMGNVDAWLIEPPDLTDADEPDMALARWCAEQMTDADRAYVRAFPAVIERPLGAGRTLLCFHGSPRSYHDVIAPLTPDDALDAMLGETPAALMAGGHTHLQMVRRHGDAHLINPGSVGLPAVGPPTVQRNHHVRWAEYAVVDVDGDCLDISLRRTLLDIDRMVQLAAGSGMPTPAIEWWMGRWDRS
jgi:predicted phosphodiesterase